MPIVLFLFGNRRRRLSHHRHLCWQARSLMRRDSTVPKWAPCEKGLLKKKAVNIRVGPPCYGKRGKERAPVSEACGHKSHEEARRGNKESPSIRPVSHRRTYRRTVYVRLTLLMTRNERQVSDFRSNTELANICHVLLQFLQYCEHKKVAVHYKALERAKMAFVDQTEKATYSDHFPFIPSFDSDLHARILYQPSSMTE